MLYAFWEPSLAKPRSSELIDSWPLLQHELAEIFSAPRMYM